MLIKEVINLLTIHKLNYIKYNYILTRLNINKCNTNNNDNQNTYITLIINYNKDFHSTQMQGNVLTLTPYNFKRDSNSK